MLSILMVLLVISVFPAPAHSIFYYQQNTLSPTNIPHFAPVSSKYSQSGFLPAIHQHRQHPSHHVPAPVTHKQLSSASTNLYDRHPSYPPPQYQQHSSTALIHQRRLPLLAQNQRLVSSHSPMYSQGSYHPFSLYQQPPPQQYLPRAAPKSVPYQEQRSSSIPRQINQFPQRQIRQSPYYLNTQRYVAVPGQIVQQINYATDLPVSTPALRTGPLVAPLLQQSYYELESDPSSSNPDHNFENNEEDASNGGGTLEPPPSESEPEQPPPMMTTMSPPPPPPEDNDNRPPPPSNPHAKVIHKHVSIHAPPDDFESGDDQVTVIRPKLPGPEKHVNIIFVKAPSVRPRKQKTEVILPEQPEHKTLVYVLVKRDPAKDGSVQVRGPAPTNPPKPQVYFIRYKQHKHQENDKPFVFSVNNRSYQR